MNLKELNYIVTIADEGSISRAAEKLYMAQSSLSQFLQLYEAELGAPLFMRTSRGVRPTASGSVFLNHARQILLQYHRAQSELWDIEELSGGRIELGISTFRGTSRVKAVPGPVSQDPCGDHGKGQHVSGGNDPGGPSGHGSSGPSQPPAPQAVGFSHPG